ncbi:MAG: winged helix-turn-helix domain-containing protein [Vicinamibacterales bacterium]
MLVDYCGRGRVVFAESSCFLRNFMNTPETIENKHLYAFGPFRLDAMERVLFRDGQPVSLTPKLVELLIPLVENAGHITEKDALLERVWPGVFVEEGTLAKNVFLLRKALGGEDDQYIRTVPKRGYRFVAEVRRVERKPAGHQEPAAEIAAAKAPAGRARRALAGLALLMVLIGVALAAWQWLRPAPAADRVKLAVLPFENLSGDAEQDYLSDGLTEEMITQLARLNPAHLAVIARTSSMHFKASKKTVTEIGQELGVDYLLQGSIRRDGDGLRISAQLIQVKDQTNVWAENYGRNVKDILAVQDEVARAIAARIGIELAGENRVGLAGTVAISPEAYEDYLKGRFFWNKLTVPGYERAIEHFDAAIRKNPDFAEAYAGLADSYASLGLWGLPGREALAKAKAAAEKAVALRETLADGHASKAFIAMSYEWDWETAEREFLRALELNPSYAHAHHRYGYLLMLRGRSEQSAAELRQAQELDPLSMVINANIGFRLYLMRQYDAALAHWDKNLEMDPDFPLLHGYKACALTMQEKYPEALAELERAIGTPGVIAARGYIYGRMGRKQEARKQLEALLELRKTTFVPAFYVALLYTGVGDKDQAFAWLDRAIEERSGYLMEIHVDPMFDTLHSDARFQALLHLLGHDGVKPQAARPGGQERQDYFGNPLMSSQSPMPVSKKNIGTIWSG